MTYVFPFINLERPKNNILKTNGINSTDRLEKSLMKMKTKMKTSF